MPSLGDQRGHVATDSHKRGEAGHATIGQFLEAEVDDAPDGGRSFTLGIRKTSADIEPDSIRYLHQQRAPSGLDVGLGQQCAR